MFSENVKEYVIKLNIYRDQNNLSKKTTILASCNTYVSKKGKKLFLLEIPDIVVIGKNTIN